ncbi:MAG: DUF4382 domain-containing protein [Balneolaceae bacterium]|nr:MAG: DUF4382 domain-containing protein [Balneolaceae bacterium]
MKNIDFKRHFSTAIAAMLLLFFTMSACEQGLDNPGTLRVVMHDNPGEFQEVWIEVLRVEVNNLDDEDNGWQVIGEPGEQYDLLTLVNGNQALLADTELEAGTYRQIRLILGNNNYVVVNGDTYGLKTPSAQQTGVKLNIDAEIQPGITYTLGLDFDVNKSIVKRGNAPVPDPYLLKPVIRAYAQAATGIISGVVDPYVEGTMVSTEVEDETVSTFVEEETGAFKLVGLPAGVYDIVVDAGVDYEPFTVEDIEVKAGETTDVGVIELE